MPTRQRLTSVVPRRCLSVFDLVKQEWTDPGEGLCWPTAIGCRRQVWAGAAAVPETPCPRGPAGWRRDRDSAVQPPWAIKGAEAAEEVRVALLTAFSRVWDCSVSCRLTFNQSCPWP